MDLRVASEHYEFQMKGRMFVLSRQHLSVGMDTWVAAQHWQFRMQTHAVTAWKNAYASRSSSIVDATVSCLVGVQG